MKLKHRNNVLEVKEVGDDGTFSGYGSVFDTVDSYAERVKKGAFSNSIESKGASNIALLWQHDPRQPIGVYTEMREDKRGLYVEGKLALKTARGSEAYELLQMGAVKGLSIGFIPKKWEDDADEGIRTLTEIDLWETSIVTFPANQDAQVEAVRAAIESGETPDKQDLERVLRDAGLSKRMAKALLADGYEGLLSRRDAGGSGDSEKLLKSLEELRNRIRAA